MTVIRGFDIITNAAFTQTHEGLTHRHRAAVGREPFLPALRVHSLDLLQQKKKNKSEKINEKTSCEARSAASDDSGTVTRNGETGDARRRMY